MTVRMELATNTLLLIVASLAVLAVDTAATANVTVHNKGLDTLSPTLYAAFFETEINWGSEGGLYAEMIANRDFETLGRGVIPSAPSTSRHIPQASVASIGLDPKEPAPNFVDYDPWKAIAYGGGSVTIAVVNYTQPFPTNPSVLQVAVDCPISATDSTCEGGVSNPGFWGINVVKGRAYNLTVAMRSLGHVKRVRMRLVDSEGALVSNEATASITSPPGEWGAYAESLVATVSDSAALLQVVTSDDGTFWMDHVSVFPSDAVGGLFRRDLFEQLQKLNMGFIRMPGGNYLEGTGERTRWDWKGTAMARQRRSGHYNSAWGYWVTDGMGVYEQLRLAELLGTEAQMAVYTGYSMGAQYNLSGVFAAEAVELLEFCNGDASTPYGAQRARMGHAAPFGVGRLEVGNEELDMDGYTTQYERITSAVWEQQRNVTVVASGRWGPPIAGNPCLSAGVRCDLWDDHYYRSADEMAALGTAYDTYNRSLPNVFVGEYAANKDGKGALQNAIAEAVFLLGFERNADKVKASAFAPLFRNVAASQWSYDLINFNSSSLFVLPSFHVQSMLQKVSVGATTLAMTLEGLAAPSTIIASARAGSVDVKAANYAGEPVPLTIQLDSTFNVASSSASVVTLTSAQGPLAENSLDHPDNVSPVLSSVPITSKGLLTITLPPWSLVIVSVPTK